MSASDQPSAIRSRMNSTASRVALMTGLPIRTVGAAVMYSCQFHMGVLTKDPTDFPDILFIDYRTGCALHFTHLNLQSVNSPNLHFREGMDPEPLPIS